MPARCCWAPLICFTTGAPAAAGAAGIVAFAFAWLPALPMISYRLARLPIPSIPTGPDDLKTDTETVDGRRVLARSDRADEFLAALLGALAVLGAGGSLVLASPAVWPGCCSPPCSACSCWPGRAGSSAGGSGCPC